MPRISEYTEVVTPNSEAYLVASKDGVTNKIQSGITPLLPYKGKMSPQVQDFLSTLQTPFTSTAIASGTIAQVASIANHPGIYRITSSASLNSGRDIALSGSIFLAGLEVCDSIINLVATTNLLAYTGFSDAVPNSAPVDGAWINISGTTLTGKTSNNSSTSTTVSSYAVSAGTWYRTKVALNSNATLVTFTVYDASGNVLWTDSLATNIPTTAARLTQCRLAAINTAGGSANMVDVDFLSFWCNRPQVR